MSILITRPSPDGEQLVSKLMLMGKFAYHLPLISFSKGKNLSLLQQKLSVLTEGDFLFIVSRHAVQYAHFQLLSIGESWPETLMYYSIGKSTGIKLSSLLGITVKYPKYQETSEGLLELLKLVCVNKRHALILKGNGGRSLLADTLRKRGVYVLCCECYRRNLLYYNGKEECYRMLSLNIKTLVVTTVFILRRLYYLIPKNYRTSWLIHCKLIVVSLRMAIYAQRLGWKNIIISWSANNDVLVEILMRNS